MLAVIKVRGHRHESRAIAAAVGPLMIRSTIKPEMFPESLVARRWLSLKYAGTSTKARRLPPQLAH